MCLAPSVPGTIARNHDHQQYLWGAYHRWESLGTLQVGVCGLIIAPSTRVHSLWEACYSYPPFVLSLDNHFVCKIFWIAFYLFFEGDDVCGGLIVYFPLDECVMYDFWKQFRYKKFFNVLVLWWLSIDPWCGSCDRLYPSLGNQNSTSDADRPPTRMPWHFVGLCLIIGVLANTLGCGMYSILAGAKQPSSAVHTDSGGRDLSQDSFLSNGEVCILVLLNLTPQYKSLPNTNRQRRWNDTVGAMTRKCRYQESDFGHTEYLRIITFCVGTQSSIG